jgi:hypothetical protein
MFDKASLNISFEIIVGSKNKRQIKKSKVFPVIKHHAMKAYG